MQNEIPVRDRMTKGQSFKIGLVGDDKTYTFLKYDEKKNILGTYSDGNSHGIVAISRNCPMAVWPDLRAIKAE